jgi:hypothetical protein
MLFIKSFPCDLVQTDDLACWLEEVSCSLENTIPYHKLRLLIHEAFVNTCKFSRHPGAEVIIVIRKTDGRLDIAITDPGAGFELPESLAFPGSVALPGTCWKLVFDREMQVLAELQSDRSIRFFLEKENNLPDTELKENHRGLISILKISRNLSYHYVPNSFNYLHISC